MAPLARAALAMVGEHSFSMQLRRRHRRDCQWSTSDKLDAHLALAEALPALSEKLLLSGMQLLPSERRVDLMVRLSDGVALTTARPGRQELCFLATPPIAHSIMAALIGEEVTRISDHPLLRLEHWVIREARTRQPSSLNDGDEVGRMFVCSRVG